MTVVYHPAVQAYLAMFQVASQQNWPYVMWDSMRSVGQVSDGVERLCRSK